MESNSRSVYSKTLELEKQLRSLLRQDPQDKAIPSLRNRICETYKELILNDFEFSLSKEVEQNLWKIGFYKSIEEYRKAIRKFATATANIKKEHGHPAGMRNQLRNKCAEFRNFLARSMAFYTDLIQKLQAKYNLSLNGSVIYDPSLADSEEVVDGAIKRSGHKAYSSCHKCFIFLGDLTRYHRDLYGEPEATQTDWSLAEGYYRQALAIVPDSGNPHNQLAVVATYRDEDLEAVYRYFRSLAVKIPFSTANDNLRVLFDKNKDKLSKLLDPQGTQDKSRSGLMSRREKSTGPPDEYKLFALRYVRLHGILFTSTSLETFEELKGAMLKQLDDLLTQNALDANKLLRLLLINIFTFHRTLREGEDSVVHRNAYVLTLEVTAKIAAHTPYGNPHPPSSQLPHLSVFLDWALHHHSLLHPLVYSQETEAEGEPVCRQLGQALAPVLSSLIHSNLGEGELLPPTLAEEFDLAAFLPLSTTFTLVPPPASASSHSHRIAKMKQAIASLIQIQPTWAYMQFDDSAKIFLPTDSIVEKPQMQSIQSQPSPRNGSPEYREEPMTSEDESIDLNPIEEDDDLRRVTGVSIDLSMVDEEPRPQSHGAAGGSISLNDDEVVDDDDVDEVILFNPFARPNNHLSVPIGGERLRSNTAAVNEGEPQNTTDKNSHTEDAPVHENVTPPAKPALYVPPHRQGLDIRLHSHENGAAGREGRRRPLYVPRGSSSSSLTPPRKTVAPPPGLPPRPPPGFAPIPSNAESLFSSAQGGDPFSSFFGLGSPIAPSHVSYPFSYRPPSSPTSSTSPSIPSRPPPGFSSIQPQHQQTRLPPPGFSVSAPVSDSTTAEEQSAITSIAWPFAPHRAQQQSEDRGAEQHQGGWGSWQTLPPRQWPTNSNWQTDPALKTSNPFLT